MARRKDRPPADGTVPGYGDVMEIGGGAFATVYRATEEDTGRQVALKILKVDTVHPHLMETFAREIQALAKVSDHPNIVTLYRPLATPDGRPVLVLELCRESLAQQMRRGGPLGAQEVTRIGIKIAGALETAHRHGFLHRDMKPQNILVTQFGEPALGDFGVAALQASAQATAGVFGFTTLHAAPEILEGHHLSPATDVYGLASTMYQLLSGLAPFATFDSEAPASVILRIIRDPVRPLRSADIPIGLSDLIEAALAKAPEGRPGTALEFAEALSGVEATAGWAPTSCVAWGQSAPVPESPPAAAAPPAAPAAGDRPWPTLGAASGGQLRASAPSVALPAPATRQVIGPDQVGRGQDSPGLPPALGPSLAPLRSPLERADPTPARPVFVDPPAPEDPARTGGPALPAGTRAESVYEQTLLPGLGTRAPSDPDALDPSGPGRLGSLPASPILIGGVVAAAVVVIAAILLIVGIL